MLHLWFSAVNERCTHVVSHTLRCRDTRILIAIAAHVQGWLL